MISPMDDGKDGTNGTNGAPGTNGTNGAPGTAGTPGTNGANGTNGTSWAAGTPVAASPVLGTAYQATVASLVSVMTRATYSITLAATLTDTVELRIGPDATVATGGGTKVAEAIFGLTGIAVSIGMGIDQENQLTALVPAGWYWSVRRTAGTRAVIASAITQPMS